MGARIAENFFVETLFSSLTLREMNRDGNYITLFGSLGNPNKFYPTYGQIEKFCRLHRDSLRQEDYLTLFLFKVKGEWFVVLVGVGGGGLEAVVGLFGSSGVRRASYRHRLVVQQQTVWFLVCSSLIPGCLFF